MVKEAAAEPFDQALRLLQDALLALAPSCLRTDSCHMMPGHSRVKLVEALAAARSRNIGPYWMPAQKPAHAIDLHPCKPAVVACCWYLTEDNDTADRLGFREQMESRTCESRKTDSLWNRSKTQPEVTSQRKTHCCGVDAARSVGTLDRKGEK